VVVALGQQPSHGIERSNHADRFVHADCGGDYNGGCGGDRHGDRGGDHDRIDDRRLRAADGFLPDDQDHSGRCRVAGGQFLRSG
jgi:hypothetical protein